MQKTIYSPFLSNLIYELEKSVKYSPFLSNVISEFEKSVKSYIGKILPKRLCTLKTCNILFKAIYSLVIINLFDATGLFL